MVIAGLPCLLSEPEIVFLCLQYSSQLLCQNDGSLNLLFCNEFRDGNSSALRANHRFIPATVGIVPQVPRVSAAWQDAGMVRANRSCCVLSDRTHLAIDHIRMPRSRPSILSLARSLCGVGSSHHRMGTLPLVGGRRPESFRLCRLDPKMKTPRTTVGYQFFAWRSSGMARLLQKESPGSESKEKA
jgi:hypothetical protein